MAQALFRRGHGSAGRLAPTVDVEGLCRGLGALPHAVEAGLHDGTPEAFDDPEAALGEHLKMLGDGQGEVVDVESREMASHRVGASALADPSSCASSGCARCVASDGLRTPKPSLRRRFFRWKAMVVGDTTSSWAISLEVLPALIRLAISRSRLLSRASSRVSASTGSASGSVSSCTPCIAAAATGKRHRNARATDKRRVGSDRVAHLRQEAFTLWSRQGDD